MDLPALTRYLSLPLYIYRQNSDFCYLDLKWWICRWVASTNSEQKKLAPQRRSLQSLESWTQLPRYPAYQQKYLNIYLAFAFPGFIIAKRLNTPWLGPKSASHGEGSLSTQSDSGNVSTFAILVTPASFSSVPRKPLYQSFLLRHWNWQPTTSRFTLVVYTQLTCSSSRMIWPICSPALAGV